MRKRLLLVEWDAADWKILHPLIDAGEMPVLNRLVEAGASGELSSTQPAIPASLSTSIVTGKRAWKHGICHSAELAPDGRHLMPITAARRQSATLWQMLAHEGKRCLAMGWPASHGETGGNTTVISDRFIEPTAGSGVKPWPPAISGTYWPSELGARLDGKRVSPEDIGTNVISLYIPEWKKIDQKRDQRLSHLRLLLAADYSYQSAILELIKAEPWDFAAIRFPALAGLSRIFLPFHFSQPTGPADKDIEIYRHVVNVSCRILNNMLGQMIEQAGPDVAVVLVSGHGISGQNVSAARLRPNDNESWKSAYGIFAACGGSFAPDALLHGASILDVAPTILTWFGLPIGDDMAGRVLIESFSDIPEVARVDSWDSRIGLAPAPPVENAAIPTGNNTALALRRESDWNFVQSGLEAARYQEVLPVLDQLFREFPERVEWGHALFQCQMALGQLSAAADTLEVTLESLPQGVASLLPRAELAVAQGNFTLARTLVGEAYRLNPTHPTALRKLGLLLLRLREWNSLAEIARRALSMDEQDPIAWLGLAAAQLRKGQSAEAVEAATRAISLKYFLPDAHFVLVRALVAQGRWNEARESMQTLLKLQPENRSAATYFKRMPQADDPSSGNTA